MYYSKVISTAPNPDVFYSISKSPETNLNSHLFSCSKKLIYRLLKNYSRKNVLFTKTQIQNSKLSFTQTNSFDSLSKNSITNPLSLYFENIHYHPYSVVTDVENKSTLTDITTTCLTHVLHLVLVNYKILILISLLNVNTKI